MKRYAARTLGLLVVASVSALAQAQAPSPDAAALFEEGASAYARGDFRAAALAFEEANRRVHSGATLYNAAVAWQQARDFAQAADDLDGALADPALDAAHRRDARARLTALERHLGRVDVSADPSVVLSVAHVVKVHAPLRVHLAPGAYDVRIEHPSGRSSSRAVRVEAQTVTSVVIAPEEPAAPLAAPLREPPPARPRQPETPRTTTSTTLGWIALGAAGAAATSASAFGLVALGAKGDFDQSGATDRDAHDRAYTFRAAANVAWVTTAVFAVTGVVLLLALPRREM
jgi:hypothetical protein